MSSIYALYTENGSQRIKNSIGNTTEPFFSLSEGALPSEMLCPVVC